MWVIRLGWDVFSTGKEAREQGGLDVLIRRACESTENALHLLVPGQSGDSKNLGIRCHMVNLMRAWTLEFVKNTKQNKTGPLKLGWAISASSWEKK